jgi:hypothetical protein
MDLIKCEKIKTILCLYANSKGSIRDGHQVYRYSGWRTGLVSSGAGVLKVNKEALCKINSIEGIYLSTLHGNHFIAAETPVGEMMVIPSKKDEKKIRDAEDICKEYQFIIEIRPLRKLRVGVITTGNEIFNGRIKDKFGPILKEKFARLNCEVIKQIFVPDDVEKTVTSIHELVSEGADLIALTGVCQ